MLQMMRMMRSARRLFPAVATTMTCALAAACGHGHTPAAPHPPGTPATPPPPPRPAAPAARPSLIPWPASATFPGGAPIAITKTTTIEITPGHPDLQRIAHDLADLLRPSLDTTLPVRDIASAGS